MRASRIAKLVPKVCDRRDLWTVWADFVELSAIAVSNSMDLVQYEKREERYLAIAGRYNADEMKRMGECLGALVMDLEEGGIDDVLGKAFMDLELGAKRAGQFFTPFELCRVMAEMQVDGLAEAVAARGFVTLADPAIGAGALPLAMCLVMHERGINFQQHLHITGQDIDERAAHMAFLQLALIGAPAVIAVGDTLRMDTRAIWRTPAHVLGLWDLRLRRRAQKPESEADPAPEMQQNASAGELAVGRELQDPASEPATEAPSKGQLSLF